MPIVNQVRFRPGRSGTGSVKMTCAPPRLPRDVQGQNRKSVRDTRVDPGPNAKIER